MLLVVAMSCAATSTLDGDRALTLVKAIDIAVEHNTDKLIAEAQMQSQSGSLQVQRSFFAPSIRAGMNGSRSQNYDVSDIVSVSGYRGEAVDSAQYAVSLSKPLLLGGSISIDAQMIRDDPIFTGARYHGYQSEIGLRLNLALLRGAGTDVNSAQIRQAEQEVRATQDDFLHTLSAIVRDVSQAYWNYVAATRTLTIQNNAIERTQRQLDDTQLLVEWDERPAADLEQIKALLESRRVDLAAAEQSWQRAQQDLGLLMGIPFVQFSNLSQPADDFPEDVFDGLTLESKLIELAKDTRWDLQALNERIEGSKILLDAAQNGMLPRLDLSLFAGIGAGKGGDHGFR